MKFIPYLKYYGKVEEALEEVGEWILHSGLKVNGEVIYVSDILSGEQYK